MFLYIYFIKNSEIQLPLIPYGDGVEHAIYLFNKNTHYQSFTSNALKENFYHTGKAIFCDCSNKDLENNRSPYGFSWHGELAAPPFNRRMENINNITMEKVYFSAVSYCEIAKKNIYPFNKQFEEVKAHMSVNSALIFQSLFINRQNDEIYSFVNFTLWEDFQSFATAINNAKFPASMKQSYDRSGKTRVIMCNASLINTRSER